MENLLEELGNLMIGLEADLKRIQQSRMQLDEEQQLVERRLIATRTMIEWQREKLDGEGKTLVTVIPASSNGSSKWLGVPLAKAIERILRERPEYVKLTRKGQVRKITDLLVAEGYNFADKRPVLSVNMAISKFEQAQRREAEHN